jgi:hypothetical protein
MASTLKATLKRGALLAAANWQVTLIQSIADSVFKLLVAIPIVGGLFLVGLAAPADLTRLDWRDMLTTIVEALLSQPFVLAAFLASLAVIVVGGSTFVFLVKAGTVSTLVAGDERAGPIEQPPLRLWIVARAGQFTVERFIDACRRLFPRYARLGFGLLGLYLISGGIYLWIVIGSRSTSEGWGMTALFTAAFVAWITVVNLVYLLLQIVVTADDCGVASAFRRVAAFVRHDVKPIAAVFGVILALVVAATAASLIASAALGLIGFVPVFGLAVLPLQLAAWLLRGIVFQYLGLTSIGAYLRLYRHHRARLAPRAAPAEQTWRQWGQAPLGSGPTPT